MMAESRLPVVESLDYDRSECRAAQVQRSGASVVEETVQSKKRFPGWQVGRGMEYAMRWQAAKEPPSEEGGVIPGR